MSVTAAEVNRTPNDSARWPRGLLALTLVLAVAAPVALYGGRIPGLGELNFLIYYRLLFFNDVMNSLAMFAGLLLAISLRPLRDLAGHLARWVSLHPGKSCAGAFVAFAVLSRIVYQGFPLAMDEYAPLLQARIFAEGDLAIVYPRELLDRIVVPGFQGSFILVNHATGQAVSGYWPGLALLMAPFAKLGGEWLLNPLLGAVGLLLLGDLARQASGKNEARGWAMVAALACPQYVVNAISYYAMPGLLTLNLLYLWLLLRPGWKPALLAGLVGSLALVMHNPAPHTLFAIPCIMWLLSDRQRRLRLLPLAVGYLPLTALLCLGWPLLTSSMGLRPIDVSPTDSAFLASWVKKLQNTFILPNAGILEVRSYAAWKTIVWAAPGLLLVALLARPRAPIQRILLAALLLCFAFYFFFPYDQGHGWGYRYLHPAWALIALAAGVFAVTGQPQRRSFIAASLCAGLLATPVFLFTTHRTIATSAMQELPLAAGRTIVFIANQPGMYSVDLVRNYPEDRGRVIRMFSAGAEADRTLVRKLAPGATLLAADRRGSSWAVPAQSSFPEP